MSSAVAGPLMHGSIYAQVWQASAPGSAARISERRADGPLADTKPGASRSMASFVLRATSRRSLSAARRVAQ